MKFFVKAMLFLVVMTASAQKSFTEAVINPLEKDQLFFEKTFIHTNKSSYFINENIWFKAYVGEFNNKPSLSTTRLVVSLLDEKGMRIQHKNILIHKGTGVGQFQLNDSLTSGTYYLLAYTNYMRNFKDYAYFVKEIQILNSKPTIKSVNKDRYDVQLLPEGGYLLANINNVIGVKALLNGKGVDFTGSIVNTKKRTIASFNNEHLGMTKSEFFYNPKEKYAAIIHINDTVLKIDLPLAQRKGMVMNIDNSEEEDLQIQLKTNKNTLTDQQPSTYKLLLHQRNKVIDFFEITNIDSTVTHLEIDKKHFFNGINTITLFKRNQPISARKFYIEKQEKETAISLEKYNQDKDSISYKLKIYNKQSGQSLDPNLSISVLPNYADNFRETTNIKNAFMLNPFVKGQIENPAYYFNKANPKRKAHFDLLLLTQGWSQFSLAEMLIGLNPKHTHDFELGFKLTGTVSKLQANYLGLITNDDLLIDKIDLAGKTNFAFKKLLVYKGDTLRLSFMDDTDNIIKPKNISFDTVKEIPQVKFIPIRRGHQKNIDKAALNSWIEFYHPDATKLDEVTVIGKKRSKRYHNHRQLIKKYKPLVFDIGKYYQVQLPDKFKNHNNNLMSFLNFNEGVTLVNWKGVENFLRVGANKEAILSIDGNRIDSDQLPLVSIHMDDIENIMIQPHKGNRSYQVFTTENYKQNKILLYRTYIIKTGYSKSIKYYSPIYENTGVANVNWIEVDWKTSLSTNASGEIEFKIKSNPKIDNYIFSIQGFSKEGFLISEILKGF